MSKLHIRRKLLFTSNFLQKYINKFAKKRTLRFYLRLLSFLFTFLFFITHISIAFYCYFVLRRSTFTLEKLDVNYSNLNDFEAIVSINKRLPFTIEATDVILSFTGESNDENKTFGKNKNKKFSEFFEEKSNKKKVDILEIKLKVKRNKNKTYFIIKGVEQPQKNNVFNLIFDSAISGNFCFNISGNAYLISNHKISLDLSYNLPFSSMKGSSMKDTKLFSLDGIDIRNNLVSMVVKPNVAFKVNYANINIRNIKTTFLVNDSEYFQIVFRKSSNKNVGFNAEELKFDIFFLFEPNSNFMQNCFLKKEIKKINIIHSDFHPFLNFNLNNYLHILNSSATDCVQKLSLSLDNNIVNFSYDMFGNTDKFANNLSFFSKKFYLQNIEGNYICELELELCINLFNTKGGYQPILSFQLKNGNLKKMENILNLIIQRQILFVDFGDLKLRFDTETFAMSFVNGFIDFNRGIKDNNYCYKSFRHVVSGNDNILDVNTYFNETCINQKIVSEINLELKDIFLENEFFEIEIKKAKNTINLSKRGCFVNSDSKNFLKYKIFLKNENINNIENDIMARLMKFRLNECVNIDLLKVNLLNSRLMKEVYSPDFFLQLFIDGIDKEYLRIRMEPPLCTNIKNNNDCIIFNSNNSNGSNSDNESISKKYMVHEFEFKKYQTYKVNFEINPDYDEADSENYFIATLLDKNCKLVFSDNIYVENVALQIRNYNVFLNNLFTPSKFLLTDDAEINLFYVLFLFVNVKIFDDIISININNNNANKNIIKTNNVINLSKNSDILNTNSKYQFLREHLDEYFSEKKIEEEERDTLKIFEIKSPKNIERSFDLDLDNINISNNSGNVVNNKNDNIVETFYAISKPNFSSFCNSESIEKFDRDFNNIISEIAETKRNYINIENMMIFRVESDYSSRINKFTVKVSNSKAVRKNYVNCFRKYSEFIQKYSHNFYLWKYLEFMHLEMQILSKCYNESNNVFENLFLNLNGFEVKNGSTKIIGINCEREEGFTVLRLEALFLFEFFKNLQGNHLEHYYKGKVIENNKLCLGDLIIILTRIINKARKLFSSTTDSKDSKESKEIKENNKKDENNASNIKNKEDCINNNDDASKDPKKIFETLLFIFNEKQVKNFQFYKLKKDLSTNSDVKYSNSNKDIMFYVLDPKLVDKDKYELVQPEKIFLDLYLLFSYGDSTEKSNIQFILHKISKNVLSTFSYFGVFQYAFDKVKDQCLNPDKSKNKA